MKTLINNLKKVMALVIVFSFCSCSTNDELSNASTSTNSSLKTSSDKFNVFKGPEVQYLNGKARSWISINKEGFPLELAIEFTPDVLVDLPIPTDGEMVMPENNVLPGTLVEDGATVLPLHSKAKEVTPFEHIGLNFQPMGHDPGFNVPHFDLHFYAITLEERLAIPTYDQNNQDIVDAFNLFPDPTKMPNDYVKPPLIQASYPNMGKHWLPISWFIGSNTFTHIMVYGSYAQKNTFTEPMITVDYLLSGEEFSGTYSQPLTFEEPGNNYPTKYNIYHDELNGNIYITLSDFVTR